jgi:cation:H+ antiporter
MEIVQIIFYFVIGLVLMIKSADFFVDSAVKIAELSGISKLIIGATIVSLATTLPELFVSTTAILQGENEMAVGNALGSVIFNTAIILSLAAIFMSGKVDKKNTMQKSYLLIASIITLIIFAWDLQITRIEAIIQLSFVVLYTYLNVIAARQQKGETERLIVDNKTKAYTVNFAIMILSAIGIRYGAKFLVDAAVMVAERSGVSDQVIGLTILALGTSLPEFATTVTSIIKKEQSLSIGNILGANFLNITLIMGTAGILAGVEGLPIKKLSIKGFTNLIPQTLYIDLPLVLGIILLFVIPIALKGKISKWQGFIGIGAYLSYLVFLLINA